MASALHPRVSRTTESARAIVLERVSPLVREPSHRPAGIRFGEQLVAATIMARRQPRSETQARRRSKVRLPPTRLVLSDRPSRP